MSTKWKIHVRDQHDRWVDNDLADNEAEARELASGCTNQRGQMRWTATIYNPQGQWVATYKRGKEETP